MIVNELELLSQISWYFMQSTQRLGIVRCYQSVATENHGASALDALQCGIPN